MKSLRLFIVSFVAMLAVLIITNCKTVTPSPTPNPPACPIAATISGALGASMATTLQCTNLAAIQSDIQTALNLASICPVATAQAKAMALKRLKGPVGDIVCPLSIDAAMKLVGSRIPPAWGCSATNSGLAVALTVACQAVVKI